MSIPTGWCYKWMWRMHLTPYIRPSSRSFVWWEANCLCSFLFFFDAQQLPLFFCHHSANPKGCWLSFHLWAHVRVICLLGPFLFLLIFVLCEFFLKLFLCVSSLRWKITFTSLIWFPSFPLFLTILHPS
jgi:hypothetical protein